MAQDPDIVFISYDSAKRGAGIPSLMVHSSVPYGIKQAHHASHVHSESAAALQSSRCFRAEDEKSAAAIQPPRTQLSTTRTKAASLPTPLPDSEHFKT
eukprot:6186550-Pleurochrysis_carterae.AAC.8